MKLYHWAAVDVRFLAELNHSSVVAVLRHAPDSTSRVETECLSIATNKGETRILSHIMRPNHYTRCAAVRWFPTIVEDYCRCRNPVRN